MIPLCTFILRSGPNKGKPCEARAVYQVRVLGGSMRRPRCEAHAFLYPPRDRDKIVHVRY